jgi:DNA-binding transcriptional LysR family regulator
MKLSQLRDVLAVAECGSLRAAGRHLGIAQPAITRSIREIEHELEVTLFDRHAKGTSLTKMGEAFIRRAIAIQTEVRRAREEIDQLKGKGTGQVTMALSATVALAIMPTALRAFRKRFPKALVLLSEGLFQEVESQISEGQADFYVGPFDDEISSTQLEVEKLFDNRRVVVGRKGHPLAGAQSINDLQGAQWLRPTLTARNSEADFDMWFERAGLPVPDITMHVRSAFMTVLAIAGTDLLTILPPQYLEFSPSADLLEALPFAEPIRAAPICMVRRRDLPLTPMAEYLYDQMQKAGMNYARGRELHG